MPGWAMMFQTIVSQFRQRRARRKAARADARARENELRVAIERVVDTINPKLRAVSGYRKKLKPAVERSLAYCAGLVETLPLAVEVNGKTWSTDPTVRAFFSGVGDLQRVYSRSQEVQEYFDRHADQESCYALLSMLCKERSVLGMEMHGDVMRRDVRQTSVSFTDHRVVRPASSQDALRKELEQRAFDALVSYVLERIMELVSSRNSLQQQRQLLDMQLKLAHVKRASLTPLLEGKGDEAIDIEALRKQQQQTGAALEQARASLTTLGDYIERISEVLGDPQAHLKISPVSMRLNKMNIRLEGAAAAEAGHELELTEVSLGENLKRILLITRFPRDGLLARKEFLK
jgi:hypothetical protein